MLTSKKIFYGRLAAYGVIPLIVAISVMSKRHDLSIIIGAIAAALFISELLFRRYVIPDVEQAEARSRQLQQELDELNQVSHKSIGYSEGMIGLFLINRDFMTLETARELFIRVARTGESPRGEAAVTFVHAAVIVHLAMNRRAFGALLEVMSAARDATLSPDHAARAVTSSGLPVFEQLCTSMAPDVLYSLLRQRGSEDIKTFLRGAEFQLPEPWREVVMAYAEGRTPRPNTSS